MQYSNGVENALCFIQREALHLIGAIRVGDVFNQNDEWQTFGASIGVVRLGYAHVEVSRNFAVEVDLSQVETHCLRKKLIFWCR